MKFWVILATSFLIATAAPAAETYLSGTEDVPLMTGLTVDKSDNMDFDTPAGQIVVLEVSSRTLSAEQVFDYYRKTLPNLGWTEQKTGVFARDSDTLTLAVVRAQKPLVMRFEIALTSGL